MEIVILIIISYLLGSIPTSVWIGKYFYKIDVRQVGSGSSGATNTFRTLGTKAAIPVLFIDIFKGFLATKMPSILFESINFDFFQTQMICGLIAVFGHIFPIFAGFRGGKGIATLTGVILGISPLVLLFAFPVFILTLIISHYVSLGSILATISIPFVYYFILGKNENYFLFFSLLIILIVICTHWKNIFRLLNGKENVFSLNRKSNGRK